MFVTQYQGDVHACGMMRGEFVARELVKSHRDFHMEMKLNWNLSDIPQSDIMVFQRAHQIEAFNFMRAAQEAGVCCIYETDDDMLNVPDGIGEISKYHRSDSVRDTYRMFYQYADAIITSTVELAKVIKPLTMKEFWVVENYTNPEHYDLPFAQRMVEKRAKKTVTIGWTNSPVHRLEAPLVGKIGQMLLDKYETVELFMFGTTTKDMLGDWTKDAKYEKRILVVPWINDCSRVPTIMRGIDIGIAPLSKIPFNESRSNVKWQQYAILGQPCVAQKGPVYGNVRHGETGFLAETEDEWMSSLGPLVESVELRDKIGMAARLDVIQNWDLRKKAENWYHTFQVIQQKTRTTRR